MRRIIGLIMGIACIIIGIFILISYFNAKKTQTSETTATIVRIDSEMQTDSDGIDTRYYYPVIKYTIGGKDYETRLHNSGSTNSTEYKEGDKIEITYNPEKPEEISKKGSTGGIIGGIFFIIVGIIVGIATVIRKI